MDFSIHSGILPELFGSSSGGGFSILGGGGGGFTFNDSFSENQDWFFS